MRTSSLVEFSLEEENTNVHTFTADEIVTWSLDGGSDEDKFTIDETTGALSFVNAPDYETPTDSDTNNTYTVIVKPQMILLILPARH